MALLKVAAISGFISLSCTTIVSAQGFEGTMRWRNYEADLSPLLEQHGSDPAKLLGLGAERLLSLATEAGVSVDTSATDMQVKGRLFRLGHFMGDAGYAVANLETGEWLIINPEQRSYMQWTEEEMRQMRDEARAMADQPEPSPGQTGDVRATGTTRQVSGQRCSEYRITNEQSATIACISQDMEDLKRVFQAFFQSWGEGDNETQHLRTILNEGFPLSFQTVTVEDEFTASLEMGQLIGLERQSLPDNLFTVPPGFTKMTLPGGF